MTARRGARIALLPVTLSLVLASACAIAQPLAERASETGASIKLRLADGSFVRIPCDVPGPRCANGSAFEFAWMTVSPRRPPLKRGGKLFDVRKPGVVASIRG